MKKSGKRWPGAAITDGRVRAVVYPGQTLVDTEYGVVFTDGGLPGERVRVAKPRWRGGAWRSDSPLQLVQAAPERRVAPCALERACGGCALMVATPALQRELKLRWVREALAEAGADDVDVGWAPSEHELGYRRRARFAWQAGQLGYRGRRSNQIVDVQECVVLHETLRAAWAQLRAALGDKLRGDGELLLALAEAGRCVLALRTQTPQAETLYAACERLVCDDHAIAGVLLHVAETAPARWGDTSSVLPSLDPAPMAGPALGFAQTNDAVNDILVRTVVQWAEPAGLRVLELYAGAGNITVPLVQAGGKVCAVELDAAAIEACRNNLKARGLEARLQVGDADNPPAGPHAVAVLDPPRRGALAAMQRLATRPLQRIVYVSCNPARLGRDLRPAVDAGFRVDRALALDMFPNTGHVEALVRLVAPSA